MRQKTKQLICSALVRTENVANRMARVLTDSEIELLVNGIITGAAIKQDKLEVVKNKITSSRVKDLTVVKVTGYNQTVQVYYKPINEDGTEGLDVEYRTFDLSCHPEYEELFDLQVI